MGGQTKEGLPQDARSSPICHPVLHRDQPTHGAKWISVFPPGPLHFDLQNLPAVIIFSEIVHGFPIAFPEGTLGLHIRVAAMGRFTARHRCCSQNGSNQPRESRRTHPLQRIGACLCRYQHRPLHVSPGSRSRSRTGIEPAGKNDLRSLLAQKLDPPRSGSTRRFLPLILNARKTGSPHLTPLKGSGDPSRRHPQEERRTGNPNTCMGCPNSEIMIVG